MKYFNLRSIYLIPALSATFFMLSCDDDDSDDSGVTPTVEIAGTYEYEAATFIDAITFTTQQGTTEIPAGSSADDFVEVYINQNSPCGDPDDTELDLREGGALFLSCSDDNDKAIEAGTWAVNDDKSQLTISFNAAPIDLVIENVRLESDENDGTNDFKLYGNISNFPVPKDLTQPVSLQNMQLISVNIVLDRED